MTPHRPHELHITEKDFEKLKFISREGELLAQLQFAVDARRHFYPKVNTPYRCIEDFILKHGRIFHRAQDAPPVKPMPRACFEQCYRIAMRPKSKWVYCEGFGLTDLSGGLKLAVHHAWITRRDNPKEAFDLAWGEDRHANSVYIGLAFRPEFVREAYHANGQFSVLDTPRQRYPLLTGQTKLEDVAYEPNRPNH